MTNYVLLIDKHGNHVVYKRNFNTKKFHTYTVQKKTEYYPLVPMEYVCDTLSIGAVEMVFVDLPIHDPDFCISLRGKHTDSLEDVTYIANKIIVTERHSLGNIETYTRFGIKYPHLCSAFKLGFVDLVVFLTENTTHYEINKAFVCAVEQGNIDMVKYFYQNGADIHLKDKLVLQKSVYHENFEITQFLVETGANVSGNEWLLNTATFNYDNKLVKYLVEHGADISYYAMNTAIDDSEMFMCLFENGGADIARKNINSLLIKSIEGGDLRIVKLLVENGANIHDGGDKVLHTAISQNHYEIAKYLVENGSKPAFLYDFYGSKFHIVKLLMDYGCNDDITKMLVTASYHGHLDTVKYLVENGADVHVDDDKAFIYAVIESNIDVAKYLLQFGMDINMNNEYLLRYHIRRKNGGMIKFLVDNGANIHDHHPTIVKWYNEKYT